jgi:hypothetical protein
VSSGPFDDINKYDQHGHTPLFRAVRGYDHEEVERLLRLGSDPSLPCPDGYTPLMLAVSAKIDYMPLEEPSQTDIKLLDLMLSFDTVVATINDKHRKYGTALAIALFRQLNKHHTSTTFPGASIATEYDVHFRFMHVALAVVQRLVAAGANTSLPVPHETRDVVNGFFGPVKYGHMPLIELVETQSVLPVYMQAKMDILATLRGKMAMPTDIRDCRPHATLVRQAFFLRDVQQALVVLGLTDVPCAAVGVTVAMRAARQTARLSRYNMHMCWAEEILLKYIEIHSPAVNGGAAASVDNASAAQDGAARAQPVLALPAPKKTKPDKPGQSCEKCDKAWKYVLGGNARSRDAHTGRQLFLNMKYLEQQTPDAALLTSIGNFKGQTKHLGTTMDLAKHEQVKVPIPFTVGRGEGNTNPFLCADCYLDFLAEWVPVPTQIEEVD